MYLEGNVVYYVMEVLAHPVNEVTDELSSVNTVGERDCDSRLIVPYGRCVVFNLM